MAASGESGGRPGAGMAGAGLLGIALIGGLIAGGYWYWGKADPVVVPAAPVAPTADVPPPALDEPAQADLKRAQVVIEGPLETALVKAVGRDVGPALTQVVTRTLVWWVRVPQDLARGDTLDVLYQERDGQEPLVVAVRFASAKTGKTHRAYRYKSDADAFPRMYEPGGDELELRLEDSPMDDYEQITSLIRDGRGHKGVDFKAPVGTDVKAPFDGSITRKNWNWGANGNCLELTEAGGQRVALLLHLAELSDDLQVGAAVQKGQIIADSGNTGRSFAPHLHYQLETGAGKVLDPFESHPTSRRTLPAPALSGLTTEIERLDGLFADAAPPG